MAGGTRVKIKTSDIPQLAALMKMHTQMVQLSMIPIQILREQLLTSMPLVLILMRRINRLLLFLTWDLLRPGQD